MDARRAADDDREFFLDLLFYHCRLHRYVVFELKVGRFEPKVALRGISTPMAVSEWRLLPEEIREALPSAEDLSRNVSQTLREIESAPRP